MLINYDPSKKPDVTDEMVRRAIELGMHPINIICDEKGAKVNEPTGMSFLALTPFVPRTGERIDLENGRSCEVVDVRYRPVTERDTDGTAKSIILFANVIALLVEKHA